MQKLARNGYTEEEVKKVLHGAYGSRVVSFRYDLLDSNDNKKAELSQVSSGEVSFGAFSEIKRTARFTLRDQDIFTPSGYTWQDIDSTTWSEL